MKNCYLCKGGRKCKDKFLVSPYCTLLFSRKEDLKFFEFTLVIVFRNDVLAALRVCEAIDIELLPISPWNTYLLFEKQP